MVLNTKYKPTSDSLGKDELDRFYTKPSVVDELLQHIDIKDYDVVVEPSAGSGSWSSKIEDCLAIDIAPANENIIQGDFLSDDFFFDDMKKDNKILVIGNPPFGRQSKLAMRFINKSAEFADTIAFILPRSFRKESYQRRIHKNFWLVKDIDLFNEHAFIFEGKDYFAPCVFQIWERREEERDTTIRKVEPIGWNYVKREDCNLVVRRVGGKAGTAYTDNLKEMSIPPNYFLLVENPIELAEELNNHSFNIHDTVGPQSLTKSELTSFINIFFENSLNK
jgi:predicted RNA methylase